MGYNNSRLIIQQEGFYYVYSKVEIDVSQETKPIFHKIMKSSNAYMWHNIELLNSKSVPSSNCCQHKGSLNSDVEDIRSSFLAGIFHLQKGDQIFVTLSRIQKLSRGANRNCFGAFLIDQQTVIETLVCQSFYQCLFKRCNLIYIYISHLMQTILRP